MREKLLGGKKVFLCDVCGLGYLDFETARKCEEWCKKTDYLPRTWRIYARNSVKRNRKL